MNKKKLIWQVPFLLLLIIGTVVILKKQPPFRTNEGMVFGTVYKITYQHADDLQKDIKEALMEVDNSLSPYKKMLADRYASFDSGMGKDFEDGKLSLEDVYAYAKQNGEPKQVSGKQELYEAILNMYC